MEILLGGKPIGTAGVRREGLYYCFDCRCSLSGEIVYRLVARCGERTAHLGIPVPEGGRFVLRTRIPVKRLGEGPMQLRAEPKHGPLEGKFIPLSPEEPFRYLRRLENAFLLVRGGQVGVVLTEDTSG